MSTLKKNQAFQPKQSKTLRLQAQKKKKFRVQGKLPGPNRRDKKGWGGSWLVNTGSSLFLEFEEGAPKGFPNGGPPLGFWRNRVCELLSHAFLTHSITVKCFTDVQTGIGYSLSFQESRKEDILRVGVEAVPFNQVISQDRKRHPLVLSQDNFVHNILTKNILCNEKVVEWEVKKSAPWRELLREARAPSWAPPFKVGTEAFSCLPTSRPSAYRDPGVREVGRKAVSVKPREKDLGPPQEKAHPFLETPDPPPPQICAHRVFSQAPNLTPFPPQVPGSPPCLLRPRPLLPVSPDAPGARPHLPRPARCPGPDLLRALEANSALRGFRARCPGCC